MARAEETDEAGKRAGRREMEMVPSKARAWIRCAIQRIFSVGGELK